MHSRNPYCGINTANLLCAGTHCVRLQLTDCIGAPTNKQISYNYLCNLTLGLAMSLTLAQRDNSKRDTSRSLRKLVFSCSSLRALTTTLLYVHTQPHHQQPSPGLSCWRLHLPSQCHPKPIGPPPFSQLESQVQLRVPSTTVIQTFILKKRILG